MCRVVLKTNFKLSQEWSLFAQWMHADRGKPHKNTKVLIEMKWLKSFSLFTSCSESYLQSWLTGFTL